MKLCKKPIGIKMIKDIRELLKKVSNPKTHKDIVAEGAVIDIIEKDEKIFLELAVGNDRKLQLAIEAQIRTVFAKNDIDASSVKFNFGGAEPSPAPATAPTSSGANPDPAANKKDNIDGVKNIITIASGKGGVGKSTVSINLAVTLAKKGFKVGLIDADIYGPSIGKMAGLNGKQDMQVVDNKIIPIEKFGLKIMSFGFLIEDGQPVVWRGPMLGKALEQFLFDIEWGELDYLIIDMPPGTGDIQLSLAQLIKTNGSIIVTTPQSVSAIDAQRAIAMFEQVQVPILGVIENMHEFVCPHCSTSTKIFGEGGGASLAKNNKSQVLGNIPLTVALLQSGEKGKPALYEPSDEKDTSYLAAATAYNKIADLLVAKLKK